MDTYRRLMLEDDYKEIDILVSPEDSSILDRYVRTDEVLKEINQLFQIFQFNVGAFSPLTLNYDDTIRVLATGEDVGQIELNALFINLISSGKTLVDMIEAASKIDFDNDRCLKFKELYISSIYDNVFSYRFFYAIRNVCQHGYIPVSKQPDGRFCFDLFQLKNLKHFNRSGAIWKEIDGIIKEIEDVYKTEPDICFTRNIETYVKAIYEVYYHFLDTIQDYVKDVCENADDVIKNHPEYVCDKGKFQGLIIYKTENDTCHHAMPEATANETLDYFERLMKEAENYYLGRAENN